MTSIALSVLLQASMAVSAAPLSYEKGVQAAAKSGRPLLILVGAEWCRDCVVLKRDVMPKLKKTGLLDQVEFVYLDFDQNRALVSQMMLNEMIPEMILYRKTAGGWKRSNLNMSEKLQEIQAFIKTGLKTPLPKSPKSKTDGNPQDGTSENESRQ